METSQIFYCKNVGLCGTLCMVATSGKRFEYLGHSDRGRALYVATVEEHANVARIISARKAEPHEREKYEEGF